jgi:hypothetical protein
MLDQPFFSSRLLPWSLCGTLRGNFGWRYIYGFTGPLSCYLFWIFLQMNVFLFFFYFKSLNVLFLLGDVGEFAFIFASRNGVLSYVCCPIGPFRWASQIIHISIIMVLSFILVLSRELVKGFCTLAFLTVFDVYLPPSPLPICLFPRFLPQCSASFLHGLRCSLLLFLLLFWWQRGCLLLSCFFIFLILLPLFWH